MIAARGERTDAVLPFVGRREGAAGPADERGRETAQGRKQIGTQHAVARTSARISETKSTSAAPWPAAAISTAASRSVRPLENENGTSCHADPRAGEWTIRQHAAVFRQHAQRHSRRARLDLDPDRSVVAPAGLEKDAPLPDARRCPPAVSRTLFVPRSNDTSTTRTASGGPNGCPVGLEIGAFEAGAADLFGEEPVLDRMIDVFEELAVDVPIDRADAAIGVDLEDRDATAAAAGRRCPQALFFFFPPFPPRRCRGLRRRDRDDETGGKYSCESHREARMSGLLLIHRPTSRR